jgi:hypothetical protein
MTLADLLTVLEARGALPASRVKDLKTSIKYLAAALGAASPEACAVAAALAEEATWAKALEDHFATLEVRDRTISAVTRRNTRNNLRVLLRAAEAHELLAAPLPVPLLTRPNLTAWRREQYETQPYPTTYGQLGRRRYRLPQAQWPQAIQDGWRDYKLRCGLRIRETSFRSYVKLLECYLGYLVHIEERTPAWNDLFEVPTLTAFLRWHSARNGRDLTVHARQVAIVIAAMAVVLDHPARQALATLRQGLKKPAELHKKRVHHWVSLEQLEAVADACLAEGRAPLVPAGKDSRFPAAQRAGRFARGVILKLLIRVPLRQRNIREMELHKHLVRDPRTGHWHLEFSGGDLKIGHRGPHVNEYKVDLTAYRPEFIPILEEYLTVHRPKLPNADTSRFVFLTQRGNPHIEKTLHLNLSEAVGMHTGQRFYPHLIRTIWATEFLEKKQDFTTAASLLGDTLGTVMRTYYDVVHKEQFPKASAFLDEKLKPKAS